jgi:hypothetical protein
MIELLKRIFRPMPADVQVLFLGLAAGVAFVAIAWLLNDTLVPLDGLRFLSLWLSLGSADVTSFLAAVERCGVADGFVHRVVVIAAVTSVYIPLCGSILRRTIGSWSREDKPLIQLRGVLTFSVFALTVTLAGSGVVAANWPAVSNPAACTAVKLNTQW